MNRIPLLILSLTLGQAQSFEVATIKPAPDSPLRAIAVGLVPPCTGGPGTNAPLRLSCSGFTLLQFIEYAYGLRTAQVEGPEWMDEQRFDLVGSVPANATAAQVRIMMQNLLTTRFHLVVDRGSKTQSAYRLTLLKGGLKRAPIANADKEKLMSVETESRQTFMRLSQQRIAQGDSRPWFRLIVLGTIEKFVNVISMRLDHPVVNEAHLEGIYDFSAEWLANSDDSDMFAALEEQLGLKFERVNQPLEYLIVKSAAKTPEAN